MSKISKSLVISIVAFALGAPAIAAADTSELQGTSVKVSYADLNLQKQQGAEALYRRLQSAAKEACGVQELHNAGSLRAYTQARSCYRETLDVAVAKVDNDKLSSIHTS